MPSTSTRLQMCALMLAFAFTLRAEEPPNHCRAGERAVFKCILANDKLISLCGGPNRAKTLQYRFGRIDEPLELTYPATKAPAAEHFRWGGTLMYAEGGGAWLAFDNGGFTYYIYSWIGQGWAKVGVAVHKGEALVADLPCRMGTHSIGPALFDELNLPAGADEFEIPCDADGRGRPCY